MQCICLTISESLWLNKELEWRLCYAVEHNYESALLTIFTNIKNPSAVVYMDDIVKVGTPHNIHT